MYTYIRDNGEHIIRTRHGEFRAGTKAAAELAALMAENDAKVREERREELRQIALEEQAAALKFTETRKG